MFSLVFQGFWDCPVRRVEAPGPDLEAMADAVIRGEYGNGAERRNRLGHLYDAVQAIVNRKLGY